MNLSEFFALVTGLKTACTHAGMKPNSATIGFNTIEGRLERVVIKGEGLHGMIELSFEID